MQNHQRRCLADLLRYHIPHKDLKVPLGWSLVPSPHPLATCFRLAVPYGSFVSSAFNSYHFLSTTPPPPPGRSFVDDLSFFDIMSSQILTDLPFETFWLILKSLNSCGRDINALAQVNRNLYALLNPYLYRLSVHIPPNPAIAWGAYHGREATVREFLEQGSWKGSTFGAGKSPEPITLAALAGHANTVELLLNHGAQPMKRWDWNDNGTKQTGVTDWNYTESDPIRDWPPWTAALVRDRAEVLQVLIDDAGFVQRFFNFFKLLPNGYGYFNTPLKALRPSSSPERLSQMGIAR